MSESIWNRLLQPPADAAPGDTVHLSKVSATVNVSRELLQPSLESRIWDGITAAMRQTPEERAAAYERRKREVAPVQAAVLAEHAARLAEADGLRRAVLELHAPHFRDLSDSAYCDGCDAYGYEVDDTEFPCRTYELARDFVAESA